MRRLSLLGFSLLISAPVLNAQSTFNPSIPAQGFNVFTKSAVQFTAGDTHGPVATGGDAILAGNTVVCMNYNGYYPAGLNNSSNYGLVIGGRVWYKSGNTSQLNRGQVRIGSLTGGNLYQVNSSTTQTQIQLAPGAYNSSPNISTNSQTQLNAANTGNGLNFATAFNAFTNYSNIINAYPTTHSTSNAINFLSMPPTSGGGSHTINLASGKVNYLSLSGAQLAAMEASGTTYSFSKTLDSSTIVVFNVTSGGTINWSPAAFGVISDNSMADGRFILYNFPAASRINLIGGRSSIGMILAPGAAVHKTGANNAAGTIIADTLSIQYGEVHYAPFGGSLPGSSTALPVQELLLSGTVNRGIVNLNWKTTGLGNNAILSLERSTDGASFHTCKLITDGNAGIWSETPAPGTSRIYYRLSAVKGEGRSYSTVWRADLQGLREAIQISPNPFTDAVEIRNLSEAADWEIVDIRGFRVQKGHCEGTCTISGLENLPAGPYTLRVGGVSGVSSLKLIKR